MRRWGRIVRRDTGESYEEFLRGSAKASGIDANPGGSGAARSEAQEAHVEQRVQLQTRTTGSARRNGRTHLAHKAEHAVDLDTGAIVAVTLQAADQGDTTNAG